MLTYVLITPAHNEEAYIEGTIKSMISQTVLPKKWIIVSDGSTDRTDEIVKSYLSDHPWMELVRRPEHADRQFAAKVQAFNAGYEKVKSLIYDIIGNLDADLTFDKDYMEYLLEKFNEDQGLGVAGTPFIENEDDKGYDFNYANIEHVSGACQLFRRPCFEAIGGYVPIRGGGIDWTAVTTARMKGWKTRTFTERVLFHHRSMGTAKSNLFSAHFKQGKKDYYVGGHPLWEFFRALFNMKRPPYIVGGILLMAGYFYGALLRTKRPSSPELVKFYRREQMNRLKKIFKVG
jgi:glycosyltransferase involved in cell wall biosynthesis